jgi:U3 small nucleolar RNA-associated protein 11
MVLETLFAAILNAQKVLFSLALQIIDLLVHGQKPGRKRKLREDEMVNPTSQPVYKWRAQRKR